MFQGEFAILFLGLGNRVQGRIRVSCLGHAFGRLLKGYGEYPKTFARLLLT